MTLIVRPYSSLDEKAWDEFCKNSLQATFLHTRRFLSYHKERFSDLSLIIEENTKLVGLFPAALSISSSKQVISHPGITYGGLLHQGSMRGERMLEALSLIKRHYASIGLSKLIYKLVPTIYHQAPAQDDVYALFRLEAKRVRCDLGSAIDLRYRLPISDRRRRNLKKAISAGVGVVEGNQYITEFWGVVSENLQRKHGLLPVHSLEEIKLLISRFPQNIHCVCGMLNNKVVGGVLLFRTSATDHAQYIASSEIGYDVAVLDAVFEYALRLAQNNGKRWFSFGISTENSGLILNEGLHRFKSEFGAGSVVHEFYELDLFK